MIRRTLAASLLCCAVSLIPAAAHAADDGETLTPSLQELTKPSVRALPRAKQAELLGVAATGPGSLIREDGRVLVEARFESGAIARLPAVEAAGAEVLTSSREYQLATVSVPYGDLRELGAVPGLAAVTPVLAPVVRAPEPGCQGGSVISEGVAQLEVDAAREAFGLEGAGQTVGVLSDSMAQATEAVGGGKIATQQPEDVAANELPGEAGSCVGQKDPVRELRPYSPVLPNLPPTDEGRAMLQIVHDVAPYAKLAFNSAFNGELAFAEGIEKLAAPTPGGAGADVIVDDVGYFEEPFFQDGLVAASIAKVVRQGVTYLTSVGNDNLFEGSNEIASWETPAYRDSGDCPAAVRNISGAHGTHCLDFNPNLGFDRTFTIWVEPQRTLTIDLQWAEPWFGVGTDLDAYLLDIEGHQLAESASNNLATQKPVEILQWTNSSAAEKPVQLVINRYSGGSPRLKFILLENGSGVKKTEYPQSQGGDVVGPSVYGHAGAAAAISLGAVNYGEPNAPEAYSSRGPVAHYFGPVKGVTAAAALTPPEVVAKPDVAATDCGKTTFFSFQPKSEPGTWRFCGTSAAAPHAAGIAALMLEGPAKCSAQVAAGLEATARPVGEFGANAIGAGLIDAKAALEAASVSPNPVECPVPVPEYEPEVEPEKPIEPKEPIKPEEEPPTTKPETNPPAAEPPTGEPPAADPPDGTKAVPSTSIRRHPRKLVRTRGALARVAFRFAADPSGGGFRCQFDGSRWRACKTTVSRWFGLGPHVVRVQARSRVGVLDPSPAVFRFRVARLLLAAHGSHRTLRH